MNILIAMIGPALWGTTYAVTQYAFAGWPPMLLAVMRALPAGLFLLIALRPALPKGKQWQPLIISAALNIAVFFTLLFIAAVHLPSAFAAVGMASTPVFAFVINSLIYRQLPSVIQLVLAGVMLVAVWLLFDPANSSLSLMGIAAMVAAILVMLSGSLYAKKVLVTIPGKTLLVWQLTLGGLMLLPLALGQLALMGEARTELMFGTTQLFGLLWLIFANTVVAYFLFIWVLPRISIVQLAFASVTNRSRACLQVWCWWESSIPVSSMS